MMDHTFITDPPYEMLSVLTVYDVALGMVLPLVVDEKGPIAYAIGSIIENIAHWGRKAIVLRVDGSQPSRRWQRPSARHGLNRQWPRSSPGTRPNRWA